MEHMSHKKAQVRGQIRLVEEALRQTGLWSCDVPVWVRHYSSGVVPDFWQWLQFVYLPLRESGQLSGADFLAPQARLFLDLSSQEVLLQRIIELDSLAEPAPFAALKSS